jgi:hypothetical protein
MHLNQRELRLGAQIDEISQAILMDLSTKTKMPLYKTAQITEETCTVSRASRSGIRALPHIARCQAGGGCDRSTWN